MCASVLLCLRDARFIEFNPSLLGMVEANLYNDPIHFNCYPDLTISLDKRWPEKALTLNIEISGYKMLEGSKLLALI
jgi:hypothetical protein